MARLPGDVRVGDRGCPPRGPQRLEVLGVVLALDGEGIAGNVEVVGVVQTGDVGRRGRTLDGYVVPVDVVRQRHARVAEDRVHARRRRVLLLPDVARWVLRLRAQLQNRRVAGGELLLGGRGRGARRDDRTHGRG